MLRSPWQTLRTAARRPSVLGLAAASAAAGAGLSTLLPDWTHAVTAPLWIWLVTWPLCSWRMAALDRREVTPAAVPALPPLSPDDLLRALPPPGPEALARLRRSMRISVALSTVMIVLLVAIGVLAATEEGGDAWTVALVIGGDAALIVALSWIGIVRAKRLYAHTAEAMTGPLARHPARIVGFDDEAVVFEKLDDPDAPRLRAGRDMPPLLGSQPGDLAVIDGEWADQSMVAVTRPGHSKPDWLRVRVCS